MHRQATLVEVHLQQRLVMQPESTEERFVRAWPMEQYHTLMTQLVLL